MRRMSRRAFLGVAAGAAVAGRFTSSSSADPGGFVRRDGARLRLGGRTFVPYGASIYGTSNPGGHAYDRIDETIVLARDGGMNTIRIVDFLAGDPYGADEWAHVDEIVAAAGAAGLKVVLDLSAYRNLLLGEGAEPYSADWTDFIRFAATRKTAAGRPFHAEQAILYVAFAGEPQPPNGGDPLRPTTEELTAFYRRVLGQWRAFDRNHLLSAGGMFQIDWEEHYGNPDGSGIDWRAIYAIPENDVCTVHDYPWAAPPTEDIAAAVAKVSPYCAQIGKPWVVEEFGWQQTYDDPTRASYLQTQLAIYAEHGAAGRLYWNLGTELTDVGAEPTTFDLNPQRPLSWAVVRAGA